ncbi:MAG: S1C family serine protease [Aquabacterium sp.]|nr:S1C family serine protease [Aquabacterium sp.]
MNPRLSQAPACVWTLMLALLAASLLLWPLAGVAAGDTLGAQARALQRAQQAVVGVQAVAVEGARSARTLGRARQGSGVLISQDGLVLTIGYLVLEAEQVVLLRDDGQPVPARVVGYDVATGFGLLQALAPLGLEPVPLGRADRLDPQVPLMVASGGDDSAVSMAQLVSRRPFSGYWEYHLDTALFTAPPRRDHSGAGLFNAAGELVGIGSLMVADAAGPSSGSPGPRRSGNMFVPVDLLVPILADMRQQGFGAASQRAWLGVNCAEMEGRIRVVRVNDDSPADVAGLEVGDRILRIDGTEVQTLAALWQALWAGGAPEREINLLIERADQQQTLKVYSVDRMKTLKRSQGI